MSDLSSDHHELLDNNYGKQQLQTQPHQKQYLSDIEGVTAPPPPAPHILSYQTAAPAKTILITNNYSAQSGSSSSNVNGNSISSTGTNSITILTSPGPHHSVVDAASVDPSKTVVLDRINICINNHYDTGQQQSGMSTALKKEPEIKIKQEKPEIIYTTGDDVLVQQYDGRFFLGTVILVSASRCLIRYDDNTEKWAEISELKRFGASSPVDDGPLCVVCKKQQPNEIVETCKQCGRGYHRRCTNGNFSSNGLLNCRRCSFQHGASTSKVYQQPPEKTEPAKLNSRIFTDKSQLAYNVSGLSVV